MAGRPAEIQPGSERWEQLQRWCLPPPEGEGLDARATHAKAQAAGWTCSYHTIYRARRQLLEKEKQEAKQDAPSVDVLAAAAQANSQDRTTPGRGRFTL